MMWLLGLLTLLAGPEPLARYEFEDLPAEQTTRGLSGAAYVGGTGAGLPLPTAGLSLTAGSLSVWIQPLDWHGDDSFYHYFVTMKLGRAGYWLLYKNSSPGTGLFYGWDPDEAPARRFNRSRSIVDWAPGAWHHLVATWLDQDRFELYLDGRRVGLGRGIDLPDDRLLPATLTVGQGQVNHPGRTAIDDLRLYRRALLPAEVLALYGERAEPAAVAAARETLPDADDLPGVRIAHAALDRRLLVTVRPEACGATPLAAAVLTVSNAAGEVVANERLTPAAEARQFDTSGWPLGRYTVRLALHDAAEARLGELTRSFEVVTQQTWAEAARLGIEPAIPPPYAPLAVQGDEVRAAEAVFRLGADGLPASLTVAGEELLAGAVRLELAGLATRPAPATPLVVTPAAVTRSAALSTDHGPIELRSRLEFDGFAWFEISIPAEVAARAQAIRLAIPFQRAAARYLNALLDAPSAHDRIKGYHVLGQGDGPLWSEAAFTPAIWVGADQRGLGWFAESDEHWQPGGAAATLEGAGEVVTLRLNLRVGAGATGPLRYGFGLQPTPARPLASDWRAEQWLSSPDISRYFLSLRTGATPPAEPPLGSIAYLYDYNEFCNRLPNQPELFARQVAEAQRRGLYPAPYTDILFHSEGSAEVALHRAEIEAQPGARFASTPMAAISTLPVGKGADHYVWFISHLIERYGLNGLYIDEAWVHPVTGPAELGLGYTAADGTRRATWPLRARREMLRRIRNLYAAAGRPFRILLHLSAARVPPFLSFGDHLLLGEEFYTLVTRDPIYAHSLTPERLRAAFLAGSVGLPTVVLPQFKASGARMADPKLARGFLSTVLPHDLIIWPLFIHTPTVDAARGALLRAGVGQAAEFVGYWDPRPPASAPPGILVSAWRTTAGQAVLVVANPTDQPAPATRLRLDTSRLRAAAGAAVTALDGRPLAGGAADLTLDLEAHDFRLLAVGN